MGDPEFIYPNWNVADNIRAVFTTRLGGISEGEFSNMNLGLHVNDAAEHVERNRELLIESLELPATPYYMSQVHGTRVVKTGDLTLGAAPDADACWTDECNQVITIMTADCLPVLFASRCGSYIAGAHAGWRGLADGVLEATVEKLPVPPQEVLAWLGPAIGPKHFEVGAEVREQFVDQAAVSSRHFEPLLSEHGTQDNQSQKYLADLYGLARDRLKEVGVTAITGGSHCTYASEDLFFSHRRDKGKTGRMAALIWKV